MPLHRVGRHPDAEELAARAAANEVQIWSLTDHDEVGGLARAAKAAAEHNMIFVPGVEISVTWSAVTLHIVGLNVQYENSPLEKGLASVRNGRTERAMEMSRQLEKVGIEDVYEGALKYVGNPNLISRTHFARCLVERKVCTDIREVFERFLTPGKPGYVPHEWASLKQAVDWILESNGLPVIAHPGRYDLNPCRWMNWLSSLSKWVVLELRWSRAATPPTNTPPMRGNLFDLA